MKTWLNKLFNIYIEREIYCDQITEMRVYINRMKYSLDFNPHKELPKF